MNALTVYERVESLQMAAAALHASGYFTDVKSQAQAMVKVMAGAELGLPPFASMSGIHIVQGKPVLGANVIATLVKNSGRYDYRIRQSDGNVCVLEWRENGQPVGESSFTMSEAQAAGLTGKDNWKKYPSDMLFARAISRGARRFAPGIFGGSPVYTPDEMSVDTDHDGYIESPSVRVIDAPTIPDYNSVMREPDPSGPTYADGSPVDNRALEHFRQYVAEHDGAVPKNVFHLRNWYKKHHGGNGAPESAALKALNDDLFGDGYDARQIEVKAALATARGELD